MPANSSGVPIRPIGKLAAIISWRSRHVVVLSRRDDARVAGVDANAILRCFAREGESTVWVGYSRQKRHLSLKIRAFTRAAALTILAAEGIPRCSTCWLHRCRNHYWKLERSRVDRAIRVSQAHYGVTIAGWMRQFSSQRTTGHQCGQRDDNIGLRQQRLNHPRAHRRAPGKKRRRSNALGRVHRRQMGLAPSSAPARRGSIRYPYNQRRPSKFASFLPASYNHRRIFYQRQTRS